MRVLITGPQGSGKTTQAEILAKFLGVPMISAGEMVRVASEGNSEEAKDLKEDLQRGDLADDKIVSSLVEKRLENEDCGDGFVMDGYPRHLSQLERFDPHYTKVYELNIPDEIAMERLLQRGRADDTKEVIEERLSVYHQETEPLLDYYKNQGILTIIDGTKSIDEVAERIKDEQSSK